MKVIEILIYGLGLLEFPFDDTQKCRPQAETLLAEKTIWVEEINPPEFWAEGDYWIGDDGKHYRLAGFRCIDKETGKEVGKSGWY
tara:strand:- start:90 stop:344 length:255 start_codon:yes stop_codon:yes gene_type:complete